MTPHHQSTVPHLKLGGQLVVHLLERHDGALRGDQHLLGPQLQVAVMHLGAAVRQHACCRSVADKLYAWRERGKSVSVPKPGAS